MSQIQEYYPYHFIHWIDLEDHLTLYDHEKNGTFEFELLRTLSESDLLNENQLGIPTALQRNSTFKVSKFRIGKSSKTIGLLFGIENVLNSLKVKGRSNSTKLTIKDILDSEEVIFKSDHLNELKYCKGVLVYISEIEVEYINFSLKRPFTFEEVTKLYTRSSLDIVKKSALYQTMKMFKKYDLPLPIVFCVKGTSEPKSSQTRVGTNEDSDYELDYCSCNQ